MRPMLDRSREGGSHDCEHKIAVKVINHYGDEVLKVYGVPAH